MKRFIKKLLIFCAMIFALSIVMLLAAPPQYTHGYNAAFIDKMKRLESIQEPKIVLVGNSNVAFGVMSELLERELGMPVVNLGLHGGLGNAFHERMPLFNLTEGDVVVISHMEYSNDDTILDPELALVTVENYFHFWKIFRLKDYPRVLFALPKYLTKCARRALRHSDTEPAPNRYWKRSAFNEYGDILISPQSLAVYEIQYEAQPVSWHPDASKTSMNRINKFVKRCQAKGVSVVIAGAPILSGVPNFSRDEYVQFQNNVESLAECPVISDFTDYFFDKEFFFDGRHLISDGARLRTLQLITDLKRFMNKGCEDARGE